MKKIIYIVLVVAVAGCSGSKETTTLPSASIHDFDKTITVDGLKSDLTIIASDEFEGRETGEEGIKKATNYITERYKELGLKPVGDNGTFEQNYDLSAPVIDSYNYTVTDNEGSLISETAVTKEATGDFVTVFGGSDDVSGEIIFAGFGISNETTNQLPEVVADKWVMVFFDRQLTNQRALQTLSGSGAAGVILIMDHNDPQGFIENAEQAQSRIGSAGRLSLAYLQNNNSRSAAWNRINPELAAKMLGKESVSELVDMSEEIKANASDFKPMELEYTLSHDVSISENTVVASNIAAFLEGSDPLLKDEVVVLSAHHDHVGIGRPDSTGDTIYNGADDDGSGTVGLLSTAQAMVAAKKAGAGPKRSVLFLHVSGEEKGLLGSRYYSDHPIYPIENTVANINVDMIGRVDKEHEENKDYIYVIGGEIISSGLDSLLRSANEATVNLDLSNRYNDLEDPNQFYRRSDHWNFGRLGVPFIFFFNGVHADYHRPSDSIEKIEWEALTKRTQLLYTTTAMIANAPNRPEVDNQAFIEKTQAQARN
ncbi:MAG: M28 family peptidase [Balneola sp.]|nr:M28 family peptidase [Balneola sp.]